MLNASALESSLKTIFAAMDAAAGGEPKDSDWYAAELAKAITDQIKTAGIPAGQVIIAVAGGSGAPATGTPNPAEITVA